jgi:DNA-directed RNA polymerase specialized sigma24 family protein
MPRKKQAWALTSTALAKFMERVGESSEDAAEKYEDLRTRLIRFFEWQGCHTPEDSADTTFDRAIQKIDAGAIVPNVERFIYGIARYVLKECRKIEDLKVPLSLAPETAQADTSDDIFLICLEQCLRELSSGGRAMLLEYHSGNNRDELAGKHGLTLNALRIRIFKLTKNLEECAVPCVARNAKGAAVS